MSFKQACVHNRITPFRVIFKDEIRKLNLVASETVNANNVSTFESKVYLCVQGITQSL